MQQALSSLVWLTLPVLFPRHLLPLLEELDFPTLPAVQATRTLYQRHIYTLQQLHEHVPPPHRGDTPPYPLSDDTMFRCLGGAAFSLSVALSGIRLPPTSRHSVRSRQTSTNVPPSTLPPARPQLQYGCKTCVWYFSHKIMLHFYKTGGIKNTSII